MPRIKHAAILTLRSLPGHTWSLLYCLLDLEDDLEEDLEEDLEGAVVTEGAVLVEGVVEGTVLMEGAGDLLDGDLLDFLEDRALALVDTLGFSALMLLSVATH